MRLRTAITILRDHAFHGPRIEDRPTSREVAFSISKVDEVEPSTDEVRKSICTCCHYDGRGLVDENDNLIVEVADLRAQLAERDARLKEAREIIADLIDVERVATGKDVARARAFLDATKETT